MSHIFISYSTKNSDYANQLADKLREEGFDVWIDNARLRSSEDWWRSIVYAIRDCAAFLVILTPESDASEFVQREITLADKYKKHTFPVLAEGDIDTPNWEFFVRKQVEDVRSFQIPEAHFYDLLAQKVNRSAEPGQDVTKRANKTPAKVDDTLQQEINNPPEPDKLDEPRAIIRAAYIGGIFAIIVAIIGGGFLILSTLLGQGDDSTPTPDLTATAAAEATSLAQAATVTPSDAPSDTPEPPTPTPVPPTATDTAIPPTNTSVPPASTLPPTSQPSPTATLTTQPAVVPSSDTVTLTLFRDEDSLTLHVPQTDAPLSLVGLEYRVTLLDGSTISRRLDRDFAGFAGMPFGNIGSLGQAMCFRLVRSGGTRPVPQACQSGVTLFPQQVNVADVFWRDGSAGVDRTVFIYRDNQLITACGPDSQCPVDWPLIAAVASAPTATNPPPAIAPTVTPTPGYPCEGTVTIPGGGVNAVNNVVYQEATRSSPQVNVLLRKDTAVTIQRKLTDSTGNDWYLIFDGTHRLGWTQVQYIIPSSDCPLT